MRSHQIEPPGSAFGSQDAGQITKKLRPPKATGVLFGEQPAGGRGLPPDGEYRPVVGGVVAVPEAFAPLPAPTVPFMPVFAPALCPAAGASSSTLPDAPPCIWVLPCAPPRVCVPDEAPCASTGPASSAEIATTTAEVFTSFIHFSQLVGNKQPAPSTPFGPSMLIAGSLMSRTARSPCKPRGVVIVQGFRGHFANPWPRTDRICGGVEPA